VTSHVGCGSVVFFCVIYVMCHLCIDFFIQYFIEGFIFVPVYLDYRENIFAVFFSYSGV